MIEINGHIYTVHSFYQGLTTYVVYEDGVEVYRGFSPTEIIERFGFNPNDIS